MEIYDLQSKHRGTDFLGCNIVPHAILIKILIDIKENYITKKSLIYLCQN